MYDINVSDDTYDTAEGATRFANQRAESRPGRIVAVAVEVFRFDDTDQEHARSKGNFRVVWSEDRNAIDLYLEAHYDRDARHAFGGCEYEVIHEAGPPESIVIGQAYNRPHDVDDHGPGCDGPLNCTCDEHSPSDGCDCPECYRRVNGGGDVLVTP